jgi:hypothetical protein
MTLLSPFGERSLTVVAASFDDQRAAESAASELLKETPALQGEVAIIRPGDPLVDRKLEPENQGIWLTLIRSHVLFGTVGALMGMSAALIAIAVPWPAAALSPGYATLFSGVFGAFFGMILAGLLTLRPDHGYVIRKVHAFSGRGRWSVVARPLNEDCSRAAYASLLHSGFGAVRSF